MARLAVGAVFGVLILAGSLSASAQAPQGQGRGAGAPQPPPQNLQVLPKDMARPQVVQIMQAFSAALGVTCNHCHVLVCLSKVRAKAIGRMSVGTSPTT